MKKLYIAGCALMSMLLATVAFASDVGFSASVYRMNPLSGSVLATGKVKAGPLRLASNEVSVTVKAVTAPAGMAELVSSATPCVHVTAEFPGANGHPAHVNDCLVIAPGGTERLALGDSSLMVEVTRNK